MYIASASQIESSASFLVANRIRVRPWWASRRSCTCATQLKVENGIVYAMHKVKARFRRGRATEAKLQPTARQLGSATAQPASSLHKLSNSTQRLRTHIHRRRRNGRAGVAQSRQLPKRDWSTCRDKGCSYPRKRKILAGQTNKHTNKQTKKRFYAL